MESYGADCLAGDLVVAYLGPDNLCSFTVKQGDVFQSKFGSCKHADLIGKPYGSKVNASKGYFHLLKATPELWTRVLPHRTQILYHTDIAFISLQLDLRPGSIVVESGTGSGSFSHALVRTIAPTGHLHTFEYHAPRAEQARQEFEEHGLSKYVTVRNCDACKDGFSLNGVADAVFLDLPSPWEAIETAKKALKKTAVTRICTFSPCIEQVQRNCDALRLQGFTDVRTFETLQRQFELRTSESVSLDDFLGSIDGKAAAAGGKGKAEATQQPNKRQKRAESASATTVVKSAKEMRGHTSYLTFATLLPPVPAST